MGLSRTAIYSRVTFCKRKKTVLRGNSLFSWLYIIITDKLVNRTQRQPAYVSMKSGSRDGYLSGGMSGLCGTYGTRVLTSGAPR